MEEGDENKDKEPWHIGPLKIIIGIFLLLIIVMMVVPFYSIKLDPEPKMILRIEEISNFITAEPNKSVTAIEQIHDIYDKNDPQIKFAADKAAAASCEGNNICYAKALYYFVRDNIKYVSDPEGSEYIESPETVIKTGAADCESGSILLLNMMESIGIDGQLVLIPGHAFIRINLYEAAAKYKNRGFIYLDWTCKNCKFGEVPYGNIRENMEILDI